MMSLDEAMVECRKAQFPLVILKQPGAILCTVAVSSRQVLLFIQVDMQTSKPVVTVVSKIRHIKPTKNMNNLQAPKQRYVSKLRLKEKQTSI